MEAEYFPPKEDVILQNEAPTDLYILVSGTVVRKLILLPFITSKFQNVLLTLAAWENHSLLQDFIVHVDGREKVFVPALSMPHVSHRLNKQKG